MRKIIFAISILFLFAIPARAQTHTVALTWTASIDAAANPTLTYNIYRANKACATATIFTIVNSGPIITTTFTDIGLQPGAYCYQGTAVLNGAESLASNQAPVVILPAAQTNLVAAPK
jgi:hypothetical protein